MKRFRTIAKLIKIKNIAKRKVIQIFRIFAQLIKE